MKFHSIDCVGSLIFQRLTSAQRGSTSPTQGKVVFDTDLNRMYYADGVGWNEIGSGSSGISETFYPYIDITGTSDEGGLLTKTQTGIGTTSGTYTILNFTGATGFNALKVRGLYIRCRIHQIGLSPESSQITCTYPDGSTKIVLESFNHLTATQEGTGIETIILVPLNRDTTDITISAICTDAAGSAQYEIIGAIQPATTNLQILMPTGSIIPYTGTSLPTGWRRCDGTAILRYVYFDLYAVIGTTYGNGDGIYTYNMPDLRGRFPVVENPVSGPAPVGYNRLPTGTIRSSIAGGEFEHQLTINEMPIHQHQFGTDSEQFSGHEVLGQWDSVAEGLTSYVGGDDPHPNTPPYQTFDYIIKT
jgi:microcystin-dependent protein